MFHRLRLRLMLLYLLASLSLIVLLGGGIYAAMSEYFQRTTDLALQHKIYHEFHMLRAPIPPDLANADLDWSSHRYRPLWWGGASSQSQPSRNATMDTSPMEAREAEIAYTGELAAIFVLALDTEGQLLFNPSVASAPIAPDREAVAVAMAQGQDWRTVSTADENPVRLLTYRMTRTDGPAVLQLGRMLDDQERVLRQTLFNILLFGMISLGVMGWGSWWLAGRSLVPAQQAWAHQQTFIANASHELRAPLTLLRASAEVAQRKATDPNMQELLADVLGECDHMNRVVEDLLILSRIDAGKLPIKRERFSLDTVFANLQRQILPLATNQQVTFMVEKPQEAVWGDPTYVRQILLILLDNALQHTPPGGTIQLTATHQDGRVVLSVRDTGRGIDPIHLPHIFERFYRPDSSRGESRKGAGVGLAIARSLALAQHGRIEAISQQGLGTTMRVILDAAEMP